MDHGRLSPHEVREWCRSEFRDIALPDGRLKRRLIETACSFASSPSSSVPMSCGSWAKTKGAYRLFDNDRVTPDDIFCAHRAKTIDRIGQSTRFLIVQDTTSVNFTKRRDRLGLGPTGGQSPDAENGLIMHNALALTEQGVPLGLLDVRLWARTQTSKRQKKNKNWKESQKWEDALDRTIAALPDPARAITVCDREGDIFSFLSRARDLGTHLLVRSRVNRLVVNQNYIPLLHYVQTLPVEGQYEVLVHAASQGFGKPKSEPRVAKVSVRFATVELLPPANEGAPHGARSRNLDLSVIYVKEEQTSEGAEPLSWVLLSTLKVERFEEALEKIRWYQLRWRIENYHKVLKSGCQVEQTHLETRERLEKYVALKSVIAWRIYFLTHSAREAPERSCEEVLSPHEWRALYCRIHATAKPPSRVPTLSEATRWIAQLGGFLGRKGDGEPGPRVIWRGWQRLIDISDTYAILQTENCG